MKFATAFAVGWATRSVDAGSPIGKVVQMISDLQAKVAAEGVAAKAEYEKFTEWCENGASQLQYDIKTGKATKAELEATIGEEISHIGALNTQIEELAASIATDEADLKAATAIRSKEHEDFVAEERDLVETIDMINRATGILEREMAKSGASMMQLKSANTVSEALSALVQASALSAADGSALTALVQNLHSDEDSDEALGAPAGKVYEGHGGGILDTLGDLAEKADAQLKSARAKELEAAQNFNMLEQSLSDSIKFANKDTAAAKKSLGECTETKAVAAGDLDVTSKDLAQDTANLEDLHHDCLTKAQNFEAATKSRGEELEALGKAKEIIIEATGGAASFLQVSSVGSKYTAAVRFVRDLSRKYKSPALAQLSSRMASAMRLGRAGDVFGKVRGLIRDLIDRLESEAEGDATEKGFCDKELAESTAKKEDLEGQIGKLTLKIDQQSSRGAKLKEEVANLQGALSELATSQANMDKLRSEEKASFTDSEAETSKGLEGLRQALKVLREYYASEEKAHASADGAAGGIVSLLEVCESDFSKTLAELRATEEAAVAAYEQETRENAIAKTTKTQDVKYKEKEAVQLEKASADGSSDRSGVQAELDAVLEYLGKLKDRCVAKAESYADKTAARAAEIAGLKEALQILEGEAALLQQGQHQLRGISRH